MFVIFAAEKLTKTHFTKDENLTREGNSWTSFLENWI